MSCLLTVRSRANDVCDATDLMATCYEQRASAGLIVSEATQISPGGQGYFGTPGIYSIDQIIGWSAVTEAVHARGGKIVAQLWHVGRVSHVSLQPGGSLPILSAIASAIGGGRTGLRISPVSPVNDAGQDSDPQALFDHLLEQLAHLRLAFIHVIEGATGGARDAVAFDYAALRDRFKSNNPQGAWMVSNGYTRAMALTAVASGSTDMVAFGRLLIGNPDLVRRLVFDAPMNAMDPGTLYGGGARGYADYPSWV